MDTNIKQDLVNKAIEAKENSYSPYSKFRVGCSLLTKDGTVYTGKLILTESFSSKLLFNLWFKKKVVTSKMLHMAWQYAPKELLYVTYLIL